MIVGVPSAAPSGATSDCHSIDCFGAYFYNDVPLPSGYRYVGQPLAYNVSLHCNPSLTCPDLEFTFDDWSTVSIVLTNINSF
jgi:hypothetical protein